MNRVTGLLIIEASNSNPNGNPDQESDPRLRPDNRGMISPVSFKRKLRDLVEDKEGPVWIDAKRDRRDEEHLILESKDRTLKEVIKQAKADELSRQYWDARIFGNTLLEKKEKDEKKAAAPWIRTGVVQFGVGVSISPVIVDRMTTTKVAAVEDDRDRGMAPLAFRVVLHGVYVMPYFVNPTAARKSGCTPEDIALMMKLIPHAYTHTASYVRPSVTIRHAWHIEHKTPLGSCPDHLLIDALTPSRKNPDDRDNPSSSWADYNVPSDLQPDLASRVQSCVDLIG
jgi:Cas7 group CRISPR-associated protein Csh2